MHHRLLRFVQLPVGRKTPAVLRGVRVPDHHLYFSRLRRAGPRRAENGAHRVPGALERRDFLEQRDDPQVRAVRLLQILHGQDV